MGLCTLSTELVYAIAEQLERESDLSLFARTNRYFHAILNPYLYRNHIRKHRSFALLWASRNGRTDMVQRFLDLGADVRVVEKSGHTPLTYAAAFGHAAIVKILLAHPDVDPDCLSWCSSTPSSLRDLTEPLPGSATPEINGCTGPRWSDPYTRRYPLGYDWTPFSWAAARGHLDVLKLLLEDQRVDPNPRHCLNRTPLAWACGDGHLATVKLLLAYDKVDPDPADDGGRTPLSWAACWGHSEIVKVLLADDRIFPDHKCWFGRTPLMLALQAGRKAVVELLLSNDQVDLESADDGGHTPLWYAAEGVDEEILGMLLAKGADLDVKDNNGIDLIERAQSYGRSHRVKLFRAQKRLRKREGIHDTGLLRLPKAHKTAEIISSLKKVRLAID